MYVNILYYSMTLLIRPITKSNFSYFENTQKTMAIDFIELMIFVN